MASRAQAIVAASSSSTKQLSSGNPIRRGERLRAAMRQSRDTLAALFPEAETAFLRASHSRAALARSAALYWTTCPTERDGKREATNARCHACGSARSESGEAE